MNKPQKKQQKQKKLIVHAPFPQKTVELMRLAILFIMSFSFVGICVLGYHLCGKVFIAKIQMIKLLPSNKQTSPPPKNAGGTISNGQYFDPIDILFVLKNGDKNNVIFVDLRSSEEYKKEHIKGAVSIPAYTIEKGGIVYISLQEVVQKMNASKKRSIVLYGPSSSFQRQEEIVGELKKKGYSAKVLAVGWNELRHFQNMWIPEGLWGEIDVNSLIEQN